MPLALINTEKHINMKPTVLNVLRFGLDAFGSYEAFFEWMITGNKNLVYKPCDLMSSEYGREKIIKELWDIFILGEKHLEDSK